MSSVDLRTDLVAVLERLAALEAENERLATKLQALEPPAGTPPAVLLPVTAL